MYKLDKSKFEGIFNFFQDDISLIKTGRANPAFIQDLEVEFYGSKMKIKELASISIADTRTLVIQPWDKNSVGPIDKAIRAAELGLSPVAEKDLIRITLPQLTEERRKEYVKLLHSKLEDSRIKIRRVRDDIKKAIQNDETLREDEQFKAKDDLQETVGEYNKKLEEISNKKEEELMTS